MRVSDQIVSQIQYMIVEGKLSVGQRLPNETELSRQFGVSRTSVREALSILESEGVVERHKNGGTFLCKCSLKKILSAVELACRRADRLDLEKISSALDLMRQSVGRGESGRKADLLFHQCIAMASKNQVLAGIARSLGIAEEKIAAEIAPDSAVCPESPEEHRAIYEAIRDRDPEKCSALIQKHFE